MLVVETLRRPCLPACSDVQVDSAHCRAFFPVPKSQWTTQTGVIGWIDSIWEWSEEILIDGEYERQMPMREVIETSRKVALFGREI